jgi:hypothetical protein
MVLLSVRGKPTRDAVAADRMNNRKEAYPAHNLGDDGAMHSRK